MEHRGRRPCAGVGSRCARSGGLDPRLSIARQRRAFARDDDSGSPAATPRGGAARARRRLPEAAAAYERLLARWPDLPDSWYNLAVLQRKLGRFDAALASYQQALDRGVSRPEEVHLNRGVIYSDCLRQDDAAERELRIALALNPDYVPALDNLANLKSDLGERDEALAIYERILAIDPRYYEGLARYADLKPVSGPDDPLIGRLRQALADSAATRARQGESCLRARQGAR